MATHYHLADLWVVAGMVLLGLMSIAGAVWAWSHRMTAATRAASWPTVTGEIRSTEIEVIEDSERSDRYAPIVRYRYRAGGGSHDGDRLRVGARTEFDDQLAARLAIQPYRAGERVTVYYDPDKPARAVLEPVATPSGIGQWLIFGAFLILAAGYCLITVTWHNPAARCAEGHACPPRTY